MHKSIFFFFSWTSWNMTPPVKNPLLRPLDHVQAWWPTLSCKHQPLRAGQAAPESPRGNRRGTPRAPGALLLSFIGLVYIYTGHRASARPGHQAGASGPPRAGGEGAAGETIWEGLPLPTGKDASKERGVRFRVQPALRHCRVKVKRSQFETKYIQV